MNMSSSARRAAALALAAVGLFCAAAASAQSVRVPGTNVSIDPPEGFAVTRTARTLEHAQSGSSINFQEMSPAAYPDLAEVFSSPRTASQRFRGDNIRIMRIEPITVNDKQVPRAIGDQTVGRRTVTKYMALLGDPTDGSNTLLVTFNLTDPRMLSHNDVEAAIRSITPGRVPTLEDRLQRLPFTFKESEPYRASEVVPTGVMLRAPVAPEATGEPLMILIERANTTAAPADTAEFAESLLRNSFRGVAGFEIVERATVQFAGDDGSYMIATVGELAIMQFMRVLSGGRYLLLAARGDKNALLATRAAVEEIASSVELK